MTHTITRIKHELLRRAVTVRRTERLTPHMHRVVLGGDALDGFTSPGADDHVKLFVPGPNGPEGRDYTPRRFDASARELTIDFALHEGGVATTWAKHARPGDTVEVAGPRASTIVPADFDWWILLGDETALPAIGRRVEELATGTKVTSIVTVPGKDDEQRFETAADHRAVWIHRDPHTAGDLPSLIAELDAALPASGDGFIWVGAEAGVARGLRRHCLETLQHPLAWLKVAGYWTRGRSNTPEKFDIPTG